MLIEIQMLIASAVLAALYCLPYVMAYYRYWGASGVSSDRQNVPAVPDWARRACEAHQNMNENFPHFAVLVLAAAYLDVFNDLTALGTILFFWSRLLYLVVYILGMYKLRSMFFALGLLGEGMIAYRLLVEMI